MKLTNQMVHDTIKEYRIINEIAGRYAGINYSVFGFTDEIEGYLRHVYNSLKAQGIDVTVVERTGKLEVDITITI